MVEKLVVKASYPMFVNGHTLGQLVKVPELILPRIHPGMAPRYFVLFYAVASLQISPHRAH